ncbi:MAG: hypothetical protein AAGD07_25355, partial [Planctomycetota bacterium]
QTKVQSGVARAKALLKRDAPWLPGYPLGIELCERSGASRFSSAFARATPLWTLVCFLPSGCMVVGLLAAWCFWEQEATAQVGVQALAVDHAPSKHERPVDPRFRVASSCDDLPLRTPSLLRKKQPQT